MVVLKIFPRTLSAYRPSLLVNEITLKTTITPSHYLDLAAPNESLFKIHLKKLFPEGRGEAGCIISINVSKEEPRFHPDDIRVGCENKMDPDSFYHYALFTDRIVDKIGMELFVYFCNNYRPSLTSGEKAVQFLNIAKVIGYQQWREMVIPPADHRPYSQLFVDNVFSFIYPSILIGIYEKKSEHPMLVKKLWDLFCLTDTTRLKLFMDVPDAGHLKFMLEVANRINFDFWGIKYGGKGLTEHILIHYIRGKRLELIKLILDYGFALGEMDPENRGKTCSISQYPLTHAFFDYTSKEFIHNSSVVRFLVRCYENSSDLFEFSGFKEEFQKMSRSLPLPSLPPSIVRMYLQKALNNTSQTTAMEEMAAFYEACDVHPTDSSVVAPPQLSQLSRCVIRERLAANCKLPTAINDFHLPKIMKSYLKLDF